MENTKPEAWNTPSPETRPENKKVVAGVLASGSVAVRDQLFTYPKGTFAGYVIKDLGTLAQVNLLQSLNISTYNNGVLQETKSAGQLIDLSLLGLDVLGSVPGVYNVGFKATLAFDEIKLTLNSVASVINNINVYGAFVDTSESDGGSGSGLECNSSSISVAKDGVYFDANSDGIVNVGDRINYTFAIKNTGFETVTNVSLTDNNATVSGAPIASLAVGATNTSYTATHTITQADIYAGVVYNLATATATTPFGTTITATSTDPTPCTTCPVNPSCATCTATVVPQTNSIALAKTASVSGTAALGKVVTYTFTVKNTGNTTLHNIVVTDPMVGLTISGSPIATLAPGATNTSITGTYVITQADVDAGKVTNSALVTAKDPQNNDITDISGTTLTTDDNTVTPVVQTPAIALVKTATVGGAGALNDVVTYTFAVTNTGTTTLHDIVVTDPMVGLTFVSGNTIATLAPGATDLSITATYIITQADVNAGKVTNSALVTAKDPQNNPVSDISGTTIITDDSTETPIGQRSTIALVKKAVAGGTASLNDIITYTFEVHNTGTTDLHDITITDLMGGLTITSNSIATLAVGATDDTTITGTYTITQADVDAGKVTNSAVVNGLDPLDKPVTDISGTTVGTNDNTVTLVTQTSSVALVKTAVVGGTGVLGDVITYTFAVHNTGTTTLKNIVVTDPMVGLTIVGNPIASLAPGATNSSITGTYVIKQADIIAGKVTNSALVTATPPQGVNVTDRSGTTLTTDDDTVTPVIQKPSISITKEGTYVDANNDGITNFGDRIDYSFVVTNTGESSLSNVVVTDSKTAVLGGPIILAYNTSNSTAFTATYAITQDDIDAGVVYNLATVRATPPVGAVITATSTDATPCTTCPVDQDCPTCTITKLTQTPKIALQKTAVIGGTGVGILGEVITYTFTVKNTGNTRLKNIKVTDPMVGLTITGNPIVSLDPGDTNSTIKGTYTIKQADIDAGKVINSALVTAQDPQNNNITDKSGKTLITDDPTDTPLVPKSASIALMKSASVSGTGVLNNVITYTFTVKNTGNVTLSNVVVTDPMIGLTITGSPIVSLAPGATNISIKGTYVITKANAVAGKVTNSALATAKDPQGVNVTDRSGTTLTTNDDTVTPVTQTPSISATKSGVYVDANNDGITSIGDYINYTFVVTNTGETSLSNVMITDDKVTIMGSAIPTLAYNTSNGNAFRATYNITQADIEAGVVYNLATVEGTPTVGPKVTNTTTYPVPYPAQYINDSCPTCTVTLLPQSPKIALILKGDFQDENGDGQAQIGETINYTYTIMNVGNVPLTNVYIKDAMVGLDVNNGTIVLPIGAMDDTTFSVNYSITQADIIAGHVTNQATVYGTSPLGMVVQDLSHDTSLLEDGSTVIGVDGCVIKVFNAVAPNSPGDNKILYIRGLDCYPDNTVQIFDRWGVKVYDVNGYDNNAKAFRGISEGRVTISQSKGLPNGTYFYVLNYVDKNNGKGYNQSGYLHLIND